MKFLMIKAKYPENKGFKLHRDNIGNMYIFIHFLTPVNAILKGKEVKIKPGGCVFFAPKTSQNFSSPECNLLHDWFHADASCKAFIEKYQLECETVYYPYDNQHISNIITKMEYEHMHKNKFFADAISALAKTLFIELSRSNLKTNSLSYIDKCQRDMFFRARSAIHTDFKKQWTVTQMAQLVNLSESRFYNVYKKLFGISPYHDLMKIRIHNAQALLMRENLSIEQCAGLVGFTNQYHFIRQFKQLTGITPGKFKSLNKREVVLWKK